VEGGKWEGKTPLPLRAERGEKKDEERRMPTARNRRGSLGGKSASSPAAVLGEKRENGD